MNPKNEICIPPVQPIPETLRGELCTIVARLYAVNAKLRRTHRSLFDPPEEKGCERAENRCVRDDLDELRYVLAEIEQYAREIEERIG